MSDEIAPWSAGLSEADDGRSPAELIAAYRRGPALLREAAAWLSREQLLARPVAGKLSTLEVVGHVADAEQFLADRMKRTAAMDRPLIVGAADGGYLDALHYQERDLELLLALVDVTRAQLADDLDRLGGDAFERLSVHTEIGLVTLRQHLVHAVHHLESHVASIAEKRAALGV